MAAVARLISPPALMLLFAWQHWLPLAIGSFVVWLILVWPYDIEVELEDDEPGDT